MDEASPGGAADGDRSRRRWLIGGALLLLVFAGQVLAFHRMRLDDAFITYRYGENLATGQGLTFNPGERFLGSTSPGHMLLTAGVHRLAGHEATPSVMSALGCLGWTAQALAVFLLLARALGPFGAGLVAALVALGAACSYLWVPLETQLVAALALFALLAARAKRWNATAALAALACLMRPDAAVLAGVLAAVCVYERRGRVLVPALIFVAITLPWILFATRYYGSALPHSALEKFQRSPFTKYFGHMLQLFAESAFAPARPPAYYLHAAAWLAILGGAVALARRDAFFKVVIAFGLLLFAAYALLRSIAGHDWHLYPLSLLAVVFAYSGLFVLARSAAPRAVRVLAALALMGCAGLALQRSVKAVALQDDGYWNGARHSVYRRVADYMAEHGEPGDRFAAIEVGTLAYYSGLAAYDLGGLVTNLRRDAMVDRDVRFLVLDKRYLAHAPPVPPVYGAVKGDFEAFVYYLPPRGTRSDRGRADRLRALLASGFEDRARIVTAPREAATLAARTGEAPEGRIHEHQVEERSHGARAGGARTRTDRGLQQIIGGAGGRRDRGRRSHRAGRRTDGAGRRHRGRGGADARAGDRAAAAQLLKRDLRAGPRLPERAWRPRS